MHEDGSETDQLTGIVRAVHELAAIDTGHILVFLPTERDIRETARRLRGEKLSGDGAHKTEILPLYARLSAKEQNRVFQPRSYRRIVLATNVAESSLTVPGIRYVIDTGTARISRYAPRSKVQRLPIEAISQASANQRAGRCGRTSGGICLRLYSEPDFAARAPYTTPEIQRTNLAAVILQSKALKLGDVAKFPFLDAPRQDAIRDGYKTLLEIQAIDENHKLTSLGRRLSRWPIDPRLARIILAAQEDSCLREILIIAAALEIQDPRERPVDKQQAADVAHEKFIDLRSDFLSYLKLWDFYHNLKADLSRNRLRKACQQNFLSYNRLREWTEIHRQLLLLLDKRGQQQLHQQPSGEPPAANALADAEADELDQQISQRQYAAIHRSLLTGFLSGVAYLSGEHEYTASGNVKFFLWPGSGLFHHKPKWCLVAELVETARRYGRTIARIDPAWIEPLANHCVVRSYSDPHWHRKNGTVMAMERVTLFGLPIVQQRRVPYGRIDPVTAHDIFLRDGLRHNQQDELWLVDAEKITGKTPRRRQRHSARHTATDFEFYRHNQNVLAEINKLAAKTRAREYLVGDAVIRNFYRTRVDSQVFDWHTLRSWLKKTPAAETNLQMTVPELLGEAPPAVATTEFPDQLAVGQLTLPVSYRFAPGEADDGVSVTVPQDAVGYLRSGRTGWLIPGLVEDKVTALIRSLPKALRRNFIPAPDTAAKVAARIEYGQGDLLQQIVRQLNQMSEDRVSQADFQLGSLPDHLRLNVKVVDEQGRVQAQGRDVEALRKQVGADEIPEISGDVDPRWQRDDVVTWDFGDLPLTVTLNRQGIEFPAYPAVIDQDDAVQLRLLESAAWARRLTIQGINRLYVIAKRKALRSQIAWLPQFDEWAVYASALMSVEHLREQVHNLLCRRAFLDSDPQLPRNADEFAARLDNSAERIGLATQDIARLLPKTFTAYQQARLTVEDCRGEQFQHAVTDIQAQLEHLLPADFLTTTPWRWLVELPRFLAAITHRIERLGAGTLARDIEFTYEIAELWRQCAELTARHEQERIFDAELERYRWMLEEYRVSCFAQQLGTSITVSPRRLEKQWAKVAR